MRCVAVFEGDTASNLGSAMDELMRHQPSLKTEATKAIIKVHRQCTMSKMITPFRSCGVKGISVKRNALAFINPQLKLFVKIFSVHVSHPYLLRVSTLWMAADFSCWRR